MKHPLRIDPTVARRGFRRAAALTIALFVGLVLPATAAAHAELVATTPVDGATVVGSPGELSASFSEDLTGESTLSIRNAAGERLAVGRPDPADARRLLIDPAPTLEPGTYEMRWTTFSDDGHIERGTWSFDVTAAEPSATPTAPTAAPTSAPSAPASLGPSSGPSETPAPTSSVGPGPTDPPADAGGDVLLPILAALAIVAVGGVLLLGRRGRSGPTG